MKQLLFALLALFTLTVGAQPTPNPNHCVDENTNYSSVSVSILGAPGWARVTTCYDNIEVCPRPEGGYSTTTDRICEEHYTFFGVQIVGEVDLSKYQDLAFEYIPAPGTCTPCRGGKQICNNNGNLNVESCKDQLYDFQGRLILKS